MYIIRSFFPDRQSAARAKKIHLFDAEKKDTVCRIFSGGSDGLGKGNPAHWKRVDSIDDSENEFICRACQYIKEKRSKREKEDPVIYPDGFDHSLNEIHKKRLKQKNKMLRDPFSRPKNPAGCHVYFIGCGKDFVKIGISSDIETRLNSLQTASPFLLKILNLFEVSCSEEAKRLEGMIHGLFNKHRHRGEWFYKLPIDKATEAASKLAVCIDDDEKADGVYDDIYRSFNPR